MGQNRQHQKRVWQYWATRYVTLTQGNLLPDMRWPISELIKNVQELERKMNVTYDPSCKCYTRPMTRWERVWEYVKAAWQVITTKQ